MLLRGSSPCKDVVIGLFNSYKALRTPADAAKVRNALICMRHALRLTKYDINTVAKCSLQRWQPAQEIYHWFDSLRNKRWCMVSMQSKIALY